MPEDHFAKIDLNLLVVFDAVMAEGSVKNAALRLGMNPPAVSQSLGRLRDAIGQDLFIRVGHGLRPTPYASNIWSGVRTGLGLIKTSVAFEQKFDPETEARTFVLDFPSGTDALVTPELAARAAGANGLQFRISNARAFNVLNDLRFGDCWIAMDYRPITEPGYRCELLTEQELVIVARSNFAALANGLTKELYQELPQVAVAAVRSTSVLPVNERLEAVGMARVVKYAVPGLFSAIQMLNTLDVISSMPICTAKVCQDWGDFTIHKLPFDLAKVPFYMVWHERFDGDAGHVWLRDNIRDICSKL
jgi:DNA-binding transcriptional LysR family regulator